MSKKNKGIIVLCLLGVMILIIIPFIFAKGADFGGSDDAGGDAVSVVQGEEYEPWFTPIMEEMLGDEIPGEIESLLFCIQTGIGVGVIAFFLGKWSERYNLVATESGRKQYETYLKSYKEDTVKKI